MSNWTAPTHCHRDNSPRRPGFSAASLRSWLAKTWSSLFAPPPALNLGRKHRPDYWLVVLVVALSLIGSVVLFSITPALTGGNSAQSLNFMLRQGLFLLVGLIAFVVASRIPLEFWRRYGAKLFVFAFIICFILPIMGRFHIPPAYCTNGACRWYSLGRLGTFQPAELLKFATVLFVAGFLAVRTAQNKLNSVKESLLPLGLMMILALFVIVVMQNDLGTGVSLAAIVLTQLVVAGVKLRTLLWAGLALVAAGGVAVIIAPTRLSRLTTFLGQGNITDHYHIDQATLALGSGGLTGRGLGQSVQAFGWLPESINDSIFAILGETLGFLGLLVIILIFAVLLKKIISKVDFIENPYLRLIAAGIFGWLAAHVVMNIGAMTQLLPLTGITLPLVSFGGTSMLFIMSSLGVVFAISRYTTHRKVTAEEGDERANSVRRRRVGRSHYAHRGSNR